MTAQLNTRAARIRIEDTWSDAFAMQSITMVAELRPEEHGTHTLLVDVARLSKVAWCKTQVAPFLSPDDEQVQAFGRRSALRESLLSL